ncbi:MAG: endopeptidase La [Candidatus Latescibacteria bacterium]|nr:endopeptidase La [Candidatus Latescibacterota bacterium]
MGIEFQESSENGGLPTELPVLPVRNTVLFPQLMTQLFVGRRGSIQLVEEALAGDRIIAVATQKDAEVDQPEPSQLYNVGVAAIIHRMFKVPDGNIHIIVRGIQRIALSSFTQQEPYMKARVIPLDEVVEESEEVKGLASNLSVQFQKMVSMMPALPDDLKIAVLNLEDEPARLGDFITFGMNIPVSEKQEILELLDVKERLRKLTFIVSRELEILEIGSKIQDQVQEEMGKVQRDYYLREKMKAIQKELGEEDERTVEIEELKKKIEAAGMPEEARKEAERELDRLSKMPPAAAEYTVSRTYLDWLLSLPWSVSTEDNLDIAGAYQILDEDHYGLEKIKERILEYLAVRKLKSDMKGPILCFVGPPGVGKTSLGRSIARALGRKFIRLSLGGVRDEAEIRGHRRTYIGALPGRIIQGIRKAGSNNPVFMLDEVDKIGLDFRGDPASALLEVLDPEQNFSFSDHYLDVAFDLSKVMFITTANLIEPIPSALRDRMEVIELHGYTEEEKLAIAERHLLPKQMREHGIEDGKLLLTHRAMVMISNDYTREAGLRNLEREIGKICRKVARRIAEGEEGPFVVDVDDVRGYLGPVRFFSEVAEELNSPGVATGLAWTPAGGDIIFIEATKMKGKRGLEITGQLGDVMQESAKIALSYVRSRADQLGIPSDFFEKHDFHIHVPAGAIPKDGPSAGITMVTALVSLLTGRPVRSDLAMTGEITLRGKVLPVGGVKEKVLAARRAGITTVILPKRNEKDLEDIPQHVRDEMVFLFVEQIDSVFNTAFLREANRKVA